MISPRLLLIVALRAAGVAAADCDGGYGATLFEEGKTCETQISNLGTFDNVTECAAAGAAFAAEESKTCDYLMWSDQYSPTKAPWGCRCCDGAATDKNNANWDMYEVVCGAETTLAPTSGPCSQYNKQKAVYVHPEFERDLGTANAFDVVTEVVWSDLADLERHGKNGLYEAATFGLAGTTSGGYFGPQVTGQRLKAGEDQQVLFSVWDKDDLALPRHEHCNRNCNDCASHIGGTGTQCKVFIPVAVGAVYRSRMRRTKIGVTEVVPKEDLCFEGSEAFKEFCDAFDEDEYVVTGNEWTVTIERVDTAEAWTVGAMLLGGGADDGIERLSYFDEHLGCTDCGSFYAKRQRRGPWILDPPNRLVGAAATSAAAAHSCVDWAMSSPEPGVVDIESGGDYDGPQRWTADEFSYECSDDDAFCALMAAPTVAPTAETTGAPTLEPTAETAAPTVSPTVSPTVFATNQPTKQRSPTVGCFGDSITRGDASHEGGGVIKPGRGNYPLALAAALGAAVGNYGVSGATTQSYAATEEYAAGIASEPDYAVVMLGHNDAKQKPFDEAAFRESYSRVLASIGDAANVVFVLTPVPAIGACCRIDIDTVNDELPGAVAGAVGDLGGGFVLVDAARGWNDATACFPEASRPATCADYYVDDGLHLSAQGSDLLAALVLEAIVAYETTLAPTAAPTVAPTVSPSLQPTAAPTTPPTLSPTFQPPTSTPSSSPSAAPTAAPVAAPTVSPSRQPMAAPTGGPTPVRATSEPTPRPTDQPTKQPTPRSTDQPTKQPSPRPTEQPKSSPRPTEQPTASPTSLLPGAGDAGEFGQGDGDFTEGGAGGETCEHASRNSCKSAGCTWDKKSDPKCQPGGSGGEGEDEAEAVKAPKCKKLKSEDECEANKETCEWKKDKCKDKPSNDGDAGGDACAANKKQGKCNKDPGCEWKQDKCGVKPSESDSGGAGDSTADGASKCKAITSEDECTSKANKKTCKWKNEKCKDKPSKSSGTSAACSTMDKRTCKENKTTCSWKTAKNTCKSKKS